MSSRPQQNTPVDVVALIVRAVAEWYRDNFSTINEVVVLEADRAERGEQLADDIVAREAEYSGEKRQDVALTNRRQSTIDSTKSLKRSIDAGARRTFRGQANAHDKINDFGNETASQVRSLPTALKCLRNLAYGLSTHKDALSKRLRKLDDYQVQVDALIADIESFGNTESTEQSETETAKRRRDEAREACLDYIDEAVLDADACSHEYPELMGELRTIFKTHNPQTPSTGDQPVEDVTEPVEA